MYILCLGLNHQTAGLNLRERLAFSDEQLKSTLARLGCGNGACPQAISEMVILSTCNRVEIYAFSSDPSFDALEDFLEEVQGVSRNEFSIHLYRLRGADAVTHLLQVAAGLDSMVLGETQILGQVTRAFELARGQNAAGPVLSRLFQTALHAGKRARAETGIGQNPASISSVAVRLAQQTVASLPAAQVLVLGAGEMAELAVEALRKRGVTRIQVVNRTLARARRLAGRWDGEAATFEKLPLALGQADIIITSTSAPHTIISPEMISKARSGRPLVIIDIALPRDVDPAVGELPEVCLYDLDNLQAHLEKSLARRESAVPQVEVIINEVQAEFNEYIHMLDVFPLIAELHQRAESIRQVELEKTLRRLPELTEAERQHLQAMTRALVKKILHAPITRLRASAGGPQAAEHTAAARVLFALGSQPTEEDLDDSQPSTT